MGDDFRVEERSDLIHEGIATLRQILLLAGTLERSDLIHEGIATLRGRLFSPAPAERSDLIHEGIATSPDGRVRIQSSLPNEAT